MLSQRSRNSIIISSVCASLFMLIVCGGYDESHALTEHVKAKVRVYDCETKEPIFGARVRLDYDESMDTGFAVPGMHGTAEISCSDEKVDSTDKKGKVKIELTVEGCPPDILSDDLSTDLRVSAPWYESRIEEVGSEFWTQKICLQRNGFERLSPPLLVEYPGYEIDLKEYREIFDEIREINNSRKLADKGIRKRHIRRLGNYVARKYSFAEGFDDFQDKVGYISSLESIPLLKEILDNNYPLPYKEYIIGDSESWTASRYVYKEGHRAVAKAF